jgi:hypothetical protein
MKMIIGLLAAIFCIGSAQAQSIPANIQAASCADASNIADCQMWIEGFADTVGIIKINDNQTLCPGTNVADLYAEFEQKASASSEDTRVFLLKMIKAHLCKTSEKSYGGMMTAGNLMNVADMGDIGFELASQYQKGFLDLIVFLQERFPQIHVFCGNNALLGTQLQFAHNQVTADYNLRQESAASLLYSSLQEAMPCK